MASINPNTLIGIIQGKLGDLVFVRRKDGVRLVRRPPVRHKPVTDAERLGQYRLTKSNEYAQRSKDEKDLHQAYSKATRETGRRACGLAKADFAHPPAIHDVDLTHYTGAPGESIVITTVDDFEVISVLLTITDLDENSSSTERLCGNPLALVGCIPPERL